MFLCRAKTPTVDHNHLNVKATKLIPAPIDSSTPGGGSRINSPSSSFKPPPTAPNPSTGMSMLWANTINPRLPPIASNLESLPENSLTDFKKSVSFLALINMVFVLKLYNLEGKDNPHSDL